MSAMTIYAIIKGISSKAMPVIKSKAMPIIKAYACKSCSTIGYISIENNRISYAKCPCVKGAK